MTTPHKVAVLVGSLRKDSFTRKVAAEAVAVAPPSLSCEFVDIGALPLYNQDLDAEGHVPAQWAAFRAKVASCDAVLFATPEYNRSVPGVLKNAIDVGSRPYGKSSWNAKPCAIVSVSPGALSAFGANHHLRQSLVFLNMPVLQQPEAYLGNAASFLDDKGHVAKEDTREFLRKFMQAFATWVGRNAAS